MVTGGTENESLGRLSAQMGQGRSLLSAAVAKDGEGATMEVPVVSQSGKGTNWQQR